MTSENGHSIREDPEERSKRVEELEDEGETRSAQLGGFNASTSALGSNLWPITLLRSVVFRVLGDKTSSFLFCSCPPPSSKTSVSSSNPNSSTPSSSNPPQRRHRRDWEARYDLYLSTGGRESYLVLVAIGGCCCVGGACEEVDLGWDVELVGEEQDVALTLVLLLEWSILGLGGR